MSNSAHPHRLSTLLSGIGLQACLGSLYAWSLFVPRLTAAPYGWSNTQTATVFSLAVGCIGLTAAVTGPRLAKTGFRKPALLGAVLYAIGHLIAAFALHQNDWRIMALGYGLFGGIGGGLAYIATVSAAAAAYPKKKGLATGLVVMGYALGALLMSKVLAPAALRLSDGELAPVFLAFGALLAVAAPLCANLQRTTPPAPASAAPASAGRSELRQFTLIWLIFFFSALGGLGLLAFQAGLMAERVLAAAPSTTAAEAASAGATLVALAAIANGAGRFLWGAVSDRIGRLNTFLVLTGTQALVFLMIPRVATPAAFGALICYVMLCYGGAFGTLPALVGDTFGATRLSAIYGRMLTAWAAAGILGPWLISRLKDTHAASEAARLACLGGAAALTTGFLITLFLRLRRPARADSRALAGA